MFASIALAATIAVISADTIDDNNPVGVTGIFNGNVTTAGSYDPLNHNAHRIVDDIVVPSSIGKYPLKMTRYYNSRGGFGALGPGWSFEYRWGAPNGVVYPNGNVWGSACFDPVGVSDAWQSRNTDFRLADGGTVHFVNGLPQYILDP